MTDVRELAERDLPAVADLLVRASPEHGWRRREDCESYLREMLFGNPWRDLDLPSWVAEERGRLAGFYAVMPRPMQAYGRRIRVAVGCQMSVAPEYRNTLAAIRLLRACLNGPQDLTLADRAHDRSRRMWIGLGGDAPPLYGLNWILPLRPAACLVALLEPGRVAPGWLARLARPAARCADRLLARRRAIPPSAARAAERELDPASMLSAFEALTAARPLRPHYERRPLEWLWRQVGARAAGRLRARAVIEPGGRTAGWYVYLARDGGIGEVVQLAAREGAYRLVLDRLCDDAWTRGLAALRGRLDPRRLEEHAARHCWFRREGESTLVHSRHAELLAAFASGDAFLTRLDGEWWLRFVSA